MVPKNRDANICFTMEIITDIDLETDFMYTAYHIYKIYIYKYFPIGNKDIKQLWCVFSMLYYMSWRVSRNIFSSERYCFTLRMYLTKLLHLIVSKDTIPTAASVTYFAKIQCILDSLVMFEL